MDCVDPDMGPRLRGWRWIGLAGSGAGLLGLHAWRPVTPEIFVSWAMAGYALVCAVILLAARATIRTAALWFVTVTGFIAAAVALAEIPVLLRLVDYRRVFPVIDEPWKHPGNDLDPVLLHIHRPYTRYRGVQPVGDIAYVNDVPDPGTYPFDFQVDQNGFRNAPGLARAEVAVIGDSLVEALLVPDDQLMTSRLATLLDRPVANLGQLWYGPQQELEVMRRFALPLHPQVVIWAFYGGNDLDDFLRYAEARESWSERSPGFHSFPARSFSKSLVLAGYRLVGRSPPLPRAQWCECDAPGHPGRIYLYYPDAPLGPQDRRILESVVDILAAAQRLAASNGSRLLVAYLPSKAQVYRDLCTRHAATALAQGAGSDLAQLLEKHLADQVPGAVFTDLTPTFVAATREQGLLFYPDETHWTPLGNRVAAGHLADVLHRRGLLEPPEPSHTAHPSR